MCVYIYIYIYIYIRIHARAQRRRAPSPCAAAQRAAPGKAAETSDAIQSGLHEVAGVGTSEVSPLEATGTLKLSARNW